MPRQRSLPERQNVGNDKLSKQNCILYACGIIPVTWLALLCAPLLDGGLRTLLAGFNAALNEPFHIVWCERSLKTLLIFLMIYGMCIGLYISNERVYRRREEQGSAIVEVSLENRYRRNSLGGSVLESLLTVHTAIAVEMPPDNLACRQIHFLVREVSQGTVLRLVYVLHHPEAGLPLFGEEFLFRGGMST